MTKYLWMYINAVTIITILIVMFGFVLPFLFSASSTYAVILGAIGLIVLPIILFMLSEKLYKQIKGYLNAN